MGRRAARTPDGKGHPHMQDRYDPHAIERAWQTRWESENLFRVREQTDRPKYYLLEMFPYPSGNIHMGHVRNYTIGDVVARYKRMRGFNVLHPMGWDAFGMPAENAAIANRTHPARWTYDNIDTMRAQLKRMGFSYDWAREVATCRPEYYRWEQWLFLRMYEKGLAYRRGVLRELVRPLSDRPRQRAGGGRPVLALRQAGAPEEAAAVVLPDHPVCRGAAALLRSPSGLAREGHHHAEELDRQEPGGRDPVPARKSGTGISRSSPRARTRSSGPPSCVSRPSTRSCLQLSRGTAQEAAVTEFVDRISNQDRSAKAIESYEKEGVFVGAYCINPMTGRRMPIYTANFVLMEYGTGAVMSVPTHDQRDFEFARKYGLPLMVVIQPPDAELDPATMTEAYADDGIHGRTPAASTACRTGRPWRRSRRTWSRRTWVGAPSASVCATGASPASATGGRPSRSSTASAAASSRCPTRTCRSCCRRTRTCSKAASRRCRPSTASSRSPARNAETPRPPRNRHHGHLRRVLLVLRALLQPGLHHGHVRPLRRGLLDAGRPVHRRHRARDPAPALLPLLHARAQGRGPGVLHGTVHAAADPGHGVQGNGRVPRARVPLPRPRSRRRATGGSAPSAASRSRSAGWKRCPSPSAT